MAGRGAKGAEEASGKASEKASGKDPGPAPVGPLATLLVPTDFSECSLAPVHYAYELVAAGGTVHLLHVMVEEPVPNPMYAHYSPGHAATAEERQRQEAELCARLETLAPAGAAERGVRTKVRVVEAEDVAELICAAADQLGVDAIFLGTHGRAGLARALMGSVAMRVLEHCRRQVLLVRPAHA